MSPWKRLLLVTVAALLVAGCTEAPSETDADAENGQGDGAPVAGAPPTTSSSASNTPPVVRLTADVRVGRAPLNVTFELVGSDPDREPIRWTFDANNDGIIDLDGDTLPAAYTHLYDVPGAYVARLSVTDGVASRDATLNITVHESAGGAVPEPIVFTGKITGAYVPGAAMYVPGSNNHTFEYATIVDLMEVTLVAEGTALDLDIELRDPAGKRVARNANYNEPTGTLWEPQENPLRVDDPDHLGKIGTWTVVVHPGVTVEGAYTVTVTFS